MNSTEKIIRHMKEFPESLKSEALDFIEYLAYRSWRTEEARWSEFSLSSAIRDMEKEETPYEISDLKELYE